MCTLEIFVILLLALLVLGVLAFVFDSVKETESDNPNYPTRTYKIARACSFIVKFGMVLTACGIIGSIVPAGLGLAMAFAIPKPTAVPKGSWFDHSHNVATTIPFGAVVPVDWRFMLPGEKYQSNISGFCRALMLKAPAMQDVDLKYATYFVPTRLLCDSNEEIISEITAPTVTSEAGVLDDIISGTAYKTTFPYFSLNTAFYFSLVNWILLFKKTKTPSGYTFDFDKFSTALRESASDNDLSATARSLSNWLVGGLCDYMGFPAITDEQLVKICDTYGAKSKVVVADLLASVKAVPMSLLPFKAYQSVCNHFFVPDFQRRSMASRLVDVGTSEVGCIAMNAASRLFTLRYSQYESDPYTCARTSGEVKRVGEASAVDPSVSTLNANTIRGMFALDEYARKIEYFFGDLRKQIKYMFGVVVSDRSALSPILVNAGSCPIGVSEVQNTTLDPVNAEQSSQSLGKMTAGFGKKYDTFEVEEHGVMLTCVWVRPRTSYLNKLPHLFRTFISADTIPNSLFSEIGEVALSAYDVDYNPFLWLVGSDGDKVDRTQDYFGYNSRYVEWKYTLDSFTGDFRGPLAYWHCAREFGIPSDSRPDHTGAPVGTWLTCGYDFNLINGKYTLYEQPLNRIFTQVQGVPNVRPFQLQLRFNTQIWQLYPHIDDEL